MASHMPIKSLVKALLPSQVRQWLWARKVAFGNRRIRELGDHLSTQLQEAAEKDISLLDGISTKAEWETFCEERMAALRLSLTNNVTNLETPNSVVSGTVERDRYRIENIVYQGHRDVPVTANLYRPTLSSQKTPAIIICHSHHEPKTQEELQCMGMTWAQQGCAVLIMDLLGHGERRQHPFASPANYNDSFRLDRQDYYFRHVLGMQLDLIGESLMGWMVQDVRRGIDWLWANPQVDRDRIIVIGAVAGGGDLAAVVGALDERVTAVVAFNFGPLSMGEWDSTRSLPDTARLGFWPWVILCSIAPRRLVYGREFSWDPQHDMTWKYLEKVYELYGQRDALHSVHGSGRISRHGPLDSHCTNVGPIHRKQLYPILQEWFDIPVPEQEVTEPVQKAKLECLTKEARKTFSPHRVHQITPDMAQKHLTTRRILREAEEQGTQAGQLQQELTEILRPITPFPSYRVQSTRRGFGKSGYVVLEVEENLFVRFQILWPSRLGKTKPPIVIGVTQEGNLRLKKERLPMIQSLLGQKIAVCLVEMRGIGDGRHGEVYRGRLSPSAGVTTTSLMLGESLLSSRVRDLRTVIDHLRNRKEIDENRIGLWADSLAAPNPHGKKLAVPLDATHYPERGEPLAGVATLFAALYEPDIRAVYIQGSLLSYEAMLDEPFVYQPVDSIIRGLLRIADLPDMAEALAPRPLRIEGLVDGCNRQISRKRAEETYNRARAAYAQMNQSHRLTIQAENASGEDIAKWFMAHI